MSEFRDPDALRRRAGVRGDPNRDQHFLVDDRVLDRLPGLLPEGADTTHLLEIGGGTGALTDRLLATADRVTVVEKDPELAEFLREEFTDAVSDGRLDVIEGDAMSVDLPAFTASVSNLPYGVSSELAFRLLPTDRPLILMFQAEFADRMVADAASDDYGRLSVSTAHYADAEIAERVPRTAFDPQPRVDSAVVRCRPRSPDYAVPDDDFFLRFVKALFTQRRKTVRNAIRNTAHISGVVDPSAVVGAAEESTLSQRPENLPPAEFAALAELAAETSEIGEGQ